MNYIQVCLIGAAVIIAATLISLRRTHQRVEYSVSWLGVGFALFFCALFPRFLVRGAAILGLDTPVYFVFIAGVLVLALLFEVSMVVSQLRDENVILTQRLAILEYHLLQIQSDHAGEAK
jgi:hypothetical protein